MFRPILFSELKNYSWKKFSQDLFAGLTVGVVALPLAMAFSIACGFSPARGIYTAIIAGFLISLFGGSRVQIGGPTGAFIVIIAAIYSKCGNAGLLTATLLAGGILVLFGIFKMGALIKFIPFPVTTGFTSGIAVVIFATQLNDIFGLGLENIPADFIGKLKVVGMNLPHTDWATFGIGLFTIIVICVVKRLLPKWPAMLVGMLAATAVAQILKLDIATIGSKFGELPRTLPKPGLEILPVSRFSEVLMPAFTIALLAGIESLLSATVADGMTGGRRHRPNTELIAQGLGNIGSVFFGGIPATGAIARTATNIKSGAQTPVAGMIHAVVLMLILLLLAPQAKLIPLAALAGIMAVVCYNMSEYHTFCRMFKGPKSDWAVMLTTFLLTVFVDLVVAVEVGVVLAALLFIRRMSDISNVSAITGELAGDKNEVDDPDNIGSRDVPADVVVFEVQGPFFFGAVDGFRDKVMKFSNKGINTVILRMRMVPAIDATGLTVLADFVKQCQKQKMDIVLSGVQTDSQPMKAFEHFGLIETLGKDNICPHIDDALARAKFLGSLKKA
ncbi:MAG: STAS domain-containing protein [Lentisphaerae bacterium]|nr:STAS domain-containing protein [Lentisphaerota bacterium]